MSTLTGNGIFRKLVSFPGARSRKRHLLQEKIGVFCSSSLKMVPKCQTRRRSRPAWQRAPDEHAGGSAAGAAAVCKQVDCCPHPRAATMRLGHSAHRSRKASGVSHAMAVYNYDTWPCPVAAAVGGGLGGRGGLGRRRAAGRQLRQFTLTATVYPRRSPPRHVRRRRPRARRVRWHLGGRLARGGAFSNTCCGSNTSEHLLLLLQVSARSNWRRAEPAPNPRLTLSADYAPWYKSIVEGSHGLTSCDVDAAGTRLCVGDFTPRVQVC